MSQGSYRIFIPGGDLVETFVAAPGPAGWRYFGRVHDPRTGEEVYAVDHVVDHVWRVVRFRLLSPTGDVLVEPSPSGLAVSDGKGEERSFEGADLVWSASPSSVLVLDRMLRAGHGPNVAAVRILSDPTTESEAIAVSVVSRKGDRMELAVGDQTWDILVGPEVPERGSGWFELMT
jgi:hypothetical protein